MPAIIATDNSRFVLESHDHIGGFVAELPYRNIQGEWLLNDRGAQLRGEIPYRGFKQVTTSNLYSGKHELWLYDKTISLDDPIFAGPVWDITVGSDSGVLNFAAQDSLSYLNKRVLKAFKSYTLKPEAAIADLLSYCFSVRSMNLGVVTTTTSGQNINASYLASDRRIILDVITELSAMGEGVDYYIRCVSGVPTLYLYGGLIKPSTPLPYALEYGGQLDGYSLQYNSQSICNDLDVTGSGIVGNSTNTSKITEYNARYQDVVQQDDLSVSVATTAATLIKDRYSTKTIPSIVTRKKTPIKDFDFGSQFQIVVNDGYAQVDQVVRVNGWQLTIGQGDKTTTVIYTKDTEGVS